MWELDHREDWVSKNWCFQTVVLEKTLESPLDIKEIKPVNPKGNQPWIFIGWTNAEASILGPPDARELTHSQRPWCWERLMAGGEGGDREWDGWMASFTQSTWVWTTPGDSEGQGSLACYSPWGCKESYTTEQQKNNNNIPYYPSILQYEFPVWFHSVKIYGVMPSA